jgi:predicted phosphodiesterase
MLATKPAVELAAVQRQAPKGWQAGKEMIGDQGTVTTRGTVEPDAREESLLKNAGFDPLEWSVTGPIRHSTWEAQTPTGIQELTSYRFNVQRKSPSNYDIEELLRNVRRRKSQPKQGAGAGTFHLANGDYQFGKSDGDGSAGTLDRVIQSIDNAAAEFRQSRKKSTAFGHISFMGDCMEGFVSQGGKNAWRTELTLTEQLRLTRRVFLYAIDQFAPLTERLTVVSVPGNHDEAVRSPGMTTYDDSFAVDALVAVTDAMALNPLAYGHVETFIPRKDELSVTLDVNGTVVTHYHGHQHRRGKHWEWWQGSSFDRRYPDLYMADVALSAHGHTFQLDTKGDRTWIMTPAQEQESTWWRHRTGDRGAPGALIFTTEGGRAGGFTVV